MNWALKPAVWTKPLCHRSDCLAPVWTAQITWNQILSNPIRATFKHASKCLPYGIQYDFYITQDWHSSGLCANVNRVPKQTRWLNVALDILKVWMKCVSKIEAFHVTPRSHPASAPLLCTEVAAAAPQRQLVLRHTFSSSSFFKSLCSGSRWMSKHKMMGGRRMKFIRAHLWPPCPCLLPVQSGN